MLTRNNNTPLFSMDGDLGDVLILYFGETTIDDIYVSEFMCQIRLSNHKDEWSVKVKLYRTYDDGAKEPDIDIFISELKSTLQTHLDFDFSKYLRRWKEEDSHFVAVVVDSSKHTWLMSK